MTPTQVAEVRADAEIKLRGRNVPRPIETWEQAGLPDAVLRGLEARGLARPFAIQRQALPIIMSGALGLWGGGRLALPIIKLREGHCRRWHEEMRDRCSRLAAPHRCRPRPDRRRSHRQRQDARLPPAMCAPRRSAAASRGRRGAHRAHHGAVARARLAGAFPQGGRERERERGRHLSARRGGLPPSMSSPHLIPLPPPPRSTRRRTASRAASPACA